MVERYRDVFVQAPLMRILKHACLELSAMMQTFQNGC